MELLRTLETYQRPASSSVLQGPAPNNAQKFISQQFLHQVGATESSFANCTEDLMAKWTCARCSSLPTPTWQKALDASGNRAFVARYDQFNATVIYIRGTKNWQNVQQDLTRKQLWPAAWEPFIRADDAPTVNCQVLSGFYSAWDNVRTGILNVLQNEIKDAGGRMPRVLLVGHSLGAAAATIGLLDLFSMGYEMLGTVAFESPFVFNRDGAIAFQRTLGSLCLRLTNHNDPVPHLPWGPELRSVGLELYFDASGKPTTCSFQDTLACQESMTKSTCECSGQDKYYALHPVNHCKMPSYLGFDFCECTPGRLWKFFLFQYILWSLILVLVFYLLGRGVFAPF